MEQYRDERGKPEASIIVEIEQLLEKFDASRAAYHGGDFNGVACRRIVGNANEICQRVMEILVRQNCENCDEKTIKEIVDQLEQTLGLLDAAFAYLSIMYPTDDEKKKARDAVDALSKQWRDIGLSISLKAHVMEVHVCDFHDKCGVGDKEESFIEQGHQIGLKENRRYCGLKNFIKRTESALKARSVSTHSLVMQQKIEVLHASKRTKKDDTNPTLKRVKKDEKKKEIEKQVKREAYVSKRNK